MIYLGVIIGVIIMAAMIYMAVDKKSSSMTRYAALIALALMVLTLAICLFMLFSERTVPVDWSAYKVGDPLETKEKGGNSAVLWILVIFLIAIFAVVAYLSMKENKKHKDDSKFSSKPISNW